MKKKEKKRPWTDYSDWLGIPMFSLGILTTLVMFGLYNLSVLYELPVLAGWAVIAGLIGLAIEFSLLGLVYLLIGLEMRRCPNGSPSPDNPYAVTIWC